MARLGQLRRGMGPYAGSLLAAAAVVLISLLAGVGDPRPSLALGVALAAAVFAGGFGFGLLSPALFRTTISRSLRTDTGAVTGLLTTVQQLARVLGVLTIGSVFFSAVSRGGPANSLGHWFATAMALSAAGFLLAAAVMRRLVVTAGSVP